MTLNDLLEIERTDWQRLGQGNKIADKLCSELKIAVVMIDKLTQERDEFRAKLAERNRERICGECRHWDHQWMKGGICRCTRCDLQFVHIRKTADFGCRHWKRRVK